MSSEPDTQSTPADLEASLKRLRGRKDLLKRLAEVFLEEAPETLHRLHAAHDAADAHALAFVAHRLKGESGAFNAGVLYTAAAALEDRSRKADLSGAEPHYHAVGTALTALVEQLRKFVADS